MDPDLRGMNADPKHAYEHNSNGTAHVLSTFSQCCGFGSGWIGDLHHFAGSRSASRPADPETYLSI
jgi:hypothetical protein